MLRVRLDRNHWVTAGLDGEIQAVVEGSRVFAPLKLDAGRNVGVYDRPSVWSLRVWCGRKRSRSWRNAPS